MSTEAIKRSSIWVFEAVPLLIGIYADKKILQQLDICSKKRIYENMANQWMHLFIFSCKRVGGMDSWFGRKQKVFTLFRNVTGTEFAPGLPRVSLCSVNRAQDSYAKYSIEWSIVVKVPPYKISENIIDIKCHRI